MNICFYTDQTLSGMTGGIGRITTVMVNHFRRDFGWKIYSIYAQDAKPGCILTEVDGSIKLWLHDRLNIKPSVRANYPKAAEFIRYNRVDLVFIQTSLDVVSKLRYALDKIGLNHVKIISELHFTPSKDEWLWPNKGIKGLLAPLRNPLIRWATKRAYRTAYEHGDRVFVLSERYIEGYQKYAGLTETRKLDSIPNCLSFSDTFNPDYLDEKKHDVIVVARMEDLSKRITLMLKMWQTVEQSGQFSDWTLRLVGDGPHLGLYKEMVQKLQLKQVSFEGRQNPVTYYRNARIFLMTSAFEGFPMTLLEAQQFGAVPIVFDSFVTLRDVVESGRNGIIIEDGNVQKYTDELMSLMTNEADCKQLAVNAIEDCQRFSQDHICLMWKEELEKIVSNKN